MTGASEMPVPEEARSVPVQVSEEVAGLVERMTSELGLWTSDVDAGLFLAALAVAREEEPVPAAERGPGEADLGAVDESQVDDLDHLAILDVLDGEGDLASTLAEDLPGWIEAGARLWAPRIEDADAAEASQELVEVLRDLA